MRSFWIKLCMSSVALVALVVLAGNQVSGQEEGTYLRKQETNGKEKKKAGYYVLGVVTRSTPQGAIIKKVHRGSAAEKSGLEPGDVLLRVNGTRVGIVNGDKVDWISIIRRSPSGVATLTIRDCRTGRLLKERVRLKWKVQRTDPVPETDPDPDDPDPDDQTPNDPEPDQRNQPDDPDDPPSNG